MGRKRRLRIRFPLGGLDRKSAYRQQPPFSTADCLNVRPVGAIESRERGGSRPGLIESHLDDLGSNPRFLHPMILAPGDGFTAWSETFSGAAFAEAWAQASWATDIPSILSAMAAVDTSVADAAVVRDALTIDSTEAYTVEMLVVPWSGEFHGVYRMYLRLDNTTPAIATDGVEIELTMTGSSGAYTGTATSYLASASTEYALTGGTLSSARPFWLIAQVTGDTIVVYLDGTVILNQAVNAQGGLRTGFGLECTEDGGLCLCNVFRVQYYSTGSTDALRTVLTASAGGSIWKEGPYGRMTVQAFSPDVRSDVALDTAQSGQKLYIADYGDVRALGTDGTVAGTALDSATYADWTTLGIDTDSDVIVLSNVGGATVEDTYKITTVNAGGLVLDSAPGNGTCSFRIERAPKVYDPIADTLTIMTATDGQVPTGCPLICRHMDRIYLGGAEVAPNAWYAARQGDELDFDYAQEDSQRAVSGPASEAGVPGEALTAFVSHNDDYLIMSCRNELWRLRGDPAFDGDLDNLSHTIGIVGQDAWCLGPAAEMIFLSLDGIYILPPGGDTKPISMSREVLPQELLNFDPNTTIVSLEYDIQGRGVNIFLTPDSSNTRTHWWFDWERKTFWPVTLASDHEPTATCSLQATAIEDSGVILGGRDGMLRRFTDLAETDCGTAFTSYVIAGPVSLAGDGSVGTIISLSAVIAEDSGDVTWGIYPALTFEATASAAALATGTWEAGLNANIHPGGRGQAFTLKLTSESGRRWAFEQAVATIRGSGPRRIL